MSWHASAVLVQADFGPDPNKLFAMLGLYNSQRRPDLDTILWDNAEPAFTYGLGLVAYRGWTCLSGAELIDVIADNRLGALSRHANVLAWMLEGSCGYASYQWWVNGKELRHWEEMEGSVQIDRGTPLFEQDRLLPWQIDSEERVFAAMEHLAVPMEDLNQRARFGSRRQFLDVSL